MDVDALLKAIGQLGLAVVGVTALWWAVFVPRKAKDGEKRSALIVPGWQYDESQSEIQRTRLFYEAALRDTQDQANTRIAEWRGFRDEAIAKATDADEDRRKLLEAVTSASRDISLLLELQRMAGRYAAQPGDPGHE